ncbi:MAG: restriction endonuclease subunit S [Phycisphaera sp.]|nr:MAG: restriction endonuclease subunit S [Phycisphaera sp.]
MTTGEWTIRRLGDLVSIKHGWPFKSEYFSDELTGRPIVVAVGNFRYDGGFRFGETAIKEYRGAYPDEYRLEAGDIVLIMTCQTQGGEILGVPATIPDDGNIYLHNQRLGKVAVKEPGLIDRRFLFHVFKSYTFNAELCATASGSKILHTAPTRIEAFEFACPRLDEQVAIASVLEALDDKIEQNRRTALALERLARAIFRAWFVDFEPVKAKAAGAASFPSMPQPAFDALPTRLVDSAIGPVPEGWELKSLAEACQIVSGGTPKRSVASYWGGEVPWYSVKDAPAEGQPWVIHTGESITDDGVANSTVRIVPKGATIISARGTVGRLAMAGRSMAFNQSCYGLLPPDGKSFGYIYLLLQTAVDRLQQRTHGSVFETVTRSTFEGIDVVAPEPSVLLSFGQVVTPLLELLHALEVESSKLADMRDYLLPRLLTGQVRVGESHG